VCVCVCVCARRFGNSPRRSIALIKGIHHCQRRRDACGHYVVVVIVPLDSFLCNVKLHICPPHTHTHQSTEAAIELCWRESIYDCTICSFSVEAFSAIFTVICCLLGEGRREKVSGVVLLKGDYR